MGGSRLNIQPVVPEFADCFTMVGTTGIVLSDGYLEESALVRGELELNDQRRLPAATVIIPLVCWTVRVISPPGWS